MTENCKNLLWHGTNSKALESIKSYGLSNDFGQVRTGFIHLAADSSHAACYGNNMGDGDIVVLAVEKNDLNQTLLGPDREDLKDILEQMGDDREWNEVSWEESLELSGQVTYSGTIEPSHLFILVDDELVPLTSPSFRL